MARQWDAAPRRQSLPLLPFAGHPTFYFKQGPEATGLVQGSLCCLAQRLEMAWIRCMHCCASPQGPTHFHTLMDQGAGCSGWHMGHHMAMYRGQAMRTFPCSLSCDSCFRLSLYSANSHLPCRKMLQQGQMQRTHAAGRSFCCQRPIATVGPRLLPNARRSCIARVKEITSDAEFEQEVLKVCNSMHAHLLEGP